MKSVYQNNLLKMCTEGVFKKSCWAFAFNFCFVQLNQLYYLLINTHDFYVFRVNGEFLSKLNGLILERYRDLNPGAEEEIISHDGESLRSVEVSRTNSSNSSNSADSSNSDLSKEKNLKRSKDSASSSLFCFRIISASRRFNNV